MRWLDGITDSLNVSLHKTLRDGEGQGSLACCSPWGCKESDTTWLLIKSMVVNGRDGLQAKRMTWGLKFYLHLTKIKKQLGVYILFRKEETTP